MKTHPRTMSARRTGKFSPSRGTEAHSVLLLKTSLALYGGEYIVLEVGILLEVNELRDPPPCPSLYGGEYMELGGWGRWLMDGVNWFMCLVVFGEVGGCNYSPPYREGLGEGPLVRGRVWICSVIGILF